MNILLAQKIAGISGSEYYLLKIMPALKKHGVNVVFFGISTPDEDHLNEPLYKSCVDSGITYRNYLMRHPLDLGVIREIGKVVDELNIDILHSHLLHADFWFAIYRAFNKKVKLISTKHGYQEEYLANEGFNFKKVWRNAYWLTAKIAEKFTDKSFAISKGLYDLYNFLGISNKNKFSVIHYGYDFESPSLLNSDLRKSKNQLVMVGRLIDFKGHKYAIEAVNELKEKFADLQLVIVGQGVLESKLRNDVSELGLENHIEFVGHKHNVREYMASSDVMLVPSIAEGFGIVILEGFSSKIPIVAFDVPSPSELIESGVDGLLATPFSSSSLVEKIEMLLSDKTKRERMTENAFGKLNSYFTLDRMTKETITFYEEVLEVSK